MKAESKEKIKKSAFYPILKKLIMTVPGAFAAIFCDEEGEFIEVCVEGEMDDLDIKTAGAFSAIIVDKLKQKEGMNLKSVIISCRNFSIAIYDIKGYVLTIILQRRTFSAQLEASVERAIKDFLNEAGLKEKR